MTKEEAERALDLAIGPNDADADTVREYMKALLWGILIKEDSFSGKRPFGYSGWIYDIGAPLFEAGFTKAERPIREELEALIDVL